MISETPDVKHYYCLRCYVEVSLDDTYLRKSPVMTLLSHNKRNCNGEIREITEDTWRKCREISVTCKGWKELYSKIGFTSKNTGGKKLRNLFMYHNVIPTYNPTHSKRFLNPRTHPTEFEWKTRAEIALNCSSYQELSDKLGLGKIGVAAFKKHGVIIPCNRCKVLPHTKNLRYGRIQQHKDRLLCDSCYIIEFNELKDKEGIDFVFLRSKYESGIDKAVEDISCNMSHAFDKEMMNELDKLHDELNRLNLELQMYPTLLTSGLMKRRLYLEEEIKKTEKLIFDNISNKDNPFYEPEFIKKFIEGE